MNTEAFTQLVTVVLPKLIDRIHACEARIEVLESAKNSRPRKKASQDSISVAKNLSVSLGMSPEDIAAQLNVSVEDVKECLS